MKYLVTLEIETSNGNPAKWDWENLTEETILSVKASPKALSRCVDCGIALPSGEICQPCQTARLAPVCGDCLYPVAEGCNCADK